MSNKYKIFCYKFPTENLSLKTIVFSWLTSYYYKSIIESNICQFQRRDKDVILIITFFIIFYNYSLFKYGTFPTKYIYN